jgi:uncharacterized membrane-anchored protein
MQAVILPSMIGGMMRKLAVGLLFLASLPALAEAKTYEEMFGNPPPEKLKGVLGSINFRQEALPLPGAHAQLQVPNGFYYLDSNDTTKVLTEIWGNPRSQAEGDLGMIFPAKLSPENSDAWGAVVSYSEDGYVSDVDAESTDYGSVLTDLKNATTEENPEREKAGFEPITLVGWAAPPHYDKTLHALHWARDLVFGKDANAPHTLNYQLRILGREGVLQVNFVAGMNQLQEIESNIPNVAALVSYEADKRYTDYKDGDKIAAYGLAGLIATAAGAKIAAKIGFLAVALVFLKKAGFAIVLAFGALFRPISKFFKRKSKDL